VLAPAATTLSKRRLRLHEADGKHPGDHRNKKHIAKKAGKLGRTLRSIRSPIK
jgi:hypothetical protein